MIFAKKSLGQNFLISPRVVNAIVEAGESASGKIVIEIGPGKGVLTRALLSAGAHVLAIEKDNRLIPFLTDMFKSEIASHQLKILHGDIMEIGIDDIISDSYKVIANIPYYITGALIRKFLSAEKKPSAMILMVQKEVANRIIARDGKESILSIAVKAYAKPELVMNVSRGNFFPAPNVDSAVLKLSEIRSPFSSRVKEDRFFEIVRAGFAQKRKKLSSNLSAVMTRDEIASKFEAFGIGDNTRAEDVDLNTWIRLAD